jgi:hypothetical protein
MKVKRGKYVCCVYFLSSVTPIRHLSCTDCILLSTTDYTCRWSRHKDAHNVDWLNCKLEKMWEEIVVNLLSYYCSVCQWNLRKTTKNVILNKWFPIFRTEQYRMSKSETDVLTIQPRRYSELRKHKIRILYFSFALMRDEPVVGRGQHKEEVWAH